MWQRAPAEKIVNKLPHNRRCYVTTFYLQFFGAVKVKMVFCADIGLECLAAWKDGSEMFFYGRLSGAGIVDKEDKYRCFVSFCLLSTVYRHIRNLYFTTKGSK